LEASTPAADQAVRPRQRAQSALPGSQLEIRTPLTAATDQQAARRPAPNADAMAPSALHPRASTPAQSGKADIEANRRSLGVHRDASIRPAAQQVRAAAARQATAARSASGSVAAPAVEAVTDVHIHIGRVEISARATTPSARPRDSAARKPMTLDDYMRWRRSSRKPSP
jgi:hypothetical protein